MSLFVDSSAFYAMADGDDVANKRAREIVSVDESLVTSDHVLIETWLLLNRKLGRLAANNFWSGLRGGIATIELITLGDLEAAWEIVTSFNDQDFSIVDCTSFALMNRLGITRVASFDDDFAVYRFGRGRKRAFEIVR